MFSKLVLAALLSASAFFRTARAELEPTEPAPNAVFKTGGTCHTSWNGDTNSTTLWKGMNIQLGTGDNFNMVMLMTVATGIDGTKSGTFSHPCPNVSPNAPIYFYQFISSDGSDKQWTGRFTIASVTGQTVPAPEATQPNGDKIPWGTGEIVGASVSASASNSTTSSAGTVGTNATTAPGTPIASPSVVPTIPPPAASTTVKVPVQPSQGAGNTTASSNAAPGLVAVNSRAWSVVLALGVPAMVFTIFL